MSFGISGMPEYLNIELSQRATKLGMSTDRYVVLALGHLAWRTPFAEDMGPWEKWDTTDSLPAEPNVVRLRSLDAASQE